MTNQPTFALGSSDGAKILKILCPGGCQNKEGKGKDYVGSVSKTKSGLTCQNWSSKSPHNHVYQNLGDHNFCRNPDGAPGIWCYTTSLKIWELCDVPLCGKKCFIAILYIIIGAL